MNILYIQIPTTHCFFLMVQLGKRDERIENMVVLFWIFSIIAMAIFGLFGSLLIIAKGYKSKKLELVLLGCLTFLMILIPILGGVIGVDIQQHIKLSNEWYWSIFALFGFCIVLNGLIRKIRVVSVIGGFMTGITIVQLALFSTL